MIKLFEDFINEGNDDNYELPFVLHHIEKVLPNIVVPRPPASDFEITPSYNYGEYVKVMIGGEFSKDYEISIEYKTEMINLSLYNDKKKQYETIIKDKDIKKFITKLKNII